MGCNCKKTYRTYRNLADNGEVTEEVGIIERAVQVVMQIVFGLIVSSILVVCIVPMLIYIIGCLVLGKEPSFRIINFRKRFKQND